MHCLKYFPDSFSIRGLLLTSGGWPGPQNQARRPNGKQDGTFHPWGSDQCLHLTCQSSGCMLVQSVRGDFRSTKARGDWAESCSTCPAHGAARAGAREGPARNAHRSRGLALWPEVLVPDRPGSACLPWPVNRTAFRPGSEDTSVPNRHPAAGLCLQDTPCFPVCADVFSRSRRVPVRPTRKHHLLRPAVHAPSIDRVQNLACTSAHDEYRIPGPVLSVCVAVSSLSCGLPKGGAYPGFLYNFLCL